MRVYDFSVLYITILPFSTNLKFGVQPQMTFEDAEKLFYEQYCRTHLDAKNARYVAQRHPERVRTMDEYRQNPRTCPEETLLMIGNKNEYVPAKTLQAICNDLKNWEEKQIPGLKILNMALHVDEQGAPHIHMRRAWIYRDENGVELISQGKALERLKRTLKRLKST